MRVLLINPPYRTITSTVGVGHQVPLGLLMVGGSLIDAGHEVRLVDAQCRRLGIAAIVSAAKAFDADVVMTGHAGSTPAHPTCVQMLAAVRKHLPRVKTIYGGVYPTYHAADILRDHPAVDVIVRGEGEATSVEVIAALQNRGPLEAVSGIAFRANERVVLTADRPPIRNLDACRTGWELIERWDDYRCFGLGRAAIVQFSRGCPHRCTYCGQHEFWVRWRHRDPIHLADEIERLRRRHGVRFITLADENPTTSRPLWKQFLEELARRKLGVHFFATLRADDIVRDADILPLYRAAGILYVLMGIDSTSPEVLKQVRKGSTNRTDLQACRLLKKHGIFSILGHIVGLRDETRKTFREAAEQLKLYGGDYLNAMYATPHRWTPFGDQLRNRTRIEPDQSKWDYRHQILAEPHLSPAQLFWAVKAIELRFHLPRVASLWRDRDPFRRRQMRWTFMHVGAVWFVEIGEFLLRRRSRAIKTLPAQRSRSLTVL